MIRRLSTGFTLIELLVVITIIAILAAILFPVFASAREKARQTTCASNEKQMGLAAMMYANDNDEILPDGYRGPSSGNYISWDNAILPYINMGTIRGGSGVGQGGAVFACPDDIGPHYNYLGAIVTGVRSYAINRAKGLTSISAGPAAQPLNKISKPANTILFAEYHVPGSVSSSGNITGYFTLSYIDALSYPAAAAHSGGANYTFCDGHVKWMRPGQSMVTAGNAPGAVLHFSTVGNQTGKCANAVSAPCGMWIINYDEQ